MTLKPETELNLVMHDLNVTLKPETEPNLLLDALPDEAFTRLLPHLKLVDLPLGKIISEPGMSLKHVYFPLPGCIISMLCVMADGFSAETAVLGKEGMAGIALFLGGDTTTSQAMVLCAGQAYQLDGAMLKKEFGRHSELQYLLLRYTQTLMTQMSQTADRSLQSASFTRSTSVPLAVVKSGSPAE